MTAQVRPGFDPSKVVEQAIAALRRPGASLPLEDVDRALKVSPNDPRLWHVKGLIHRAQDRRERAVPAIRRAAELAPNEPLIAHGLARVLLEAGLPCVVEFGRAVRLSPGNTEVVHGLIAALIAEGRIQDAIEGLEQVIRRSPLWKDGHVQLAHLRWVEGERSGFTRSFDEAIALHPQSLDLRREQLVALLDAEQWDDMRRCIEQGRNQIGDHVLFTSHEAAMLSESGDGEGADPLFALLADLDFANIDVWRVRHLLRSGKHAEAVRVIDRWLGTADEDLFWPYAASGWRLTGDARADWLEGDERLVGVYDLADRLPPLDQLAALLRRLHTTRGQPLAQSVRGGTQTDGHLFQRIEPEIVQLREAVRQAIEEHAAQLPPADAAHPLLRKRPEKIQFSGAWSVRLVGGGFHSNHIHPMGWLSSALYIVLPPDLGQDDAGWLTLGEPQAQLRLDLPPRRMIEPKPGRLALFPSWMWHGTRPFGEGERMTVAFDVAKPA